MRLLLASLFLLIAPTLSAQSPVATSKGAAAAPISVAVWPMKGCVISDKKIKNTFDVDGRTFQTCCGNCQEKVEADPATYAKKLDDAIIKSQTRGYPLKTCPISNKALTDTAVNAVSNGTLVRVCCNKCAAKVTSGEKPDAIAAVVSARHKRQSKTYPMKTCPVSGDELVAGESVEVMFGTQLVRLCCKGCVKELSKDSAKHLKTLKDARKSAREAKGGKTKKSKAGGEADKNGNAAAPVAAQLASKVTDKAAPAATSCCAEKAEQKPDAKTKCCAEKAEQKPDAKAKCCAEKAEQKPDAKAKCCAEKAEQKPDAKAQKVSG